MDEPTVGDVEFVEYQNRMFGKWAADQNWLRVRTVALEYHERTELFDQGVCEFKNKRKVAIPVDGKERVACERNARKVFAELSGKHGIPTYELRLAIRDTAFEFEKKWMEKQYGKVK